MSGLNPDLHKVRILWLTAWSRDPQIFQKSGSRLKILGAIIAIGDKVHIEDSQILGPSVENVVARASWRSGFVILWPDQWYGKAIGVLSYALNVHVLV